MHPKQLAVFAHHFRLEPQPEQQIERAAFIGNPLQAARQLGKVLFPVSQPAVIVVSASKPTVVEHEHIHARVRGKFDKMKELLFVEIKIYRFPTVDEDGSFAKGKIGIHQMLAAEGMKTVRHSAESAVGIHENAFGRFELFPALQKPIETERVYPAANAQAAVLRIFRRKAERTAIYKLKAVDLSMRFVGIFAFERQKRIEVVGRRAPLSRRKLADTGGAILPNRRAFGARSAEQAK